MAQIDERSHRALERLEELLRRNLPESIRKDFARALFREGKLFRSHYRGFLANVFKTGGGRRVANSFGVYTAGHDLGTLRLGVFTRWEAAPTYQDGGVIRPRKGRYLVVPITRRAYTSRGRVKRSWRNPDGSFKASLFDDLYQIRTTKGMILLVRNVKARGNRFGGATLRRPGKAGANAIEPVFLLIRSTSRRAVLRFFQEWARLAGPRGQRLQEAINRSIDKAA